MNREIRLAARPQGLPRASDFGLAQPTVSYHLKQLVEAGLLARERRGTFAYYSLVPGALARVRGLFAEPAGLAAAG